MSAASAPRAAIQQSLDATFQKRLASGLQHSRHFVLPTTNEQPQPDSAFELVTWLVLIDSSVGNF